MRKIKKLRFLFNRPQSIHVHIGAHKTATTHLQDTLASCNETLLDNGVYYIPRPEMRSKFQVLFRDGLYGRSGIANLEKYYTFTTSFFDYKRDVSRVLISEENIMGGVLDGLSHKPYQNMKVNFLNYANNFAPLTIYLSIRSFSQLLPGAYVTGLRFKPTKAYEDKAHTLSMLNQGVLPSWKNVIEQLQKKIPNCNIKLWEFERYLEDKFSIIHSLTGVGKLRVPDIPNPSETITPSQYGVEEIEKLIKKPDFSTGENWNAVCRGVYEKNMVSESNPKFTFLTKELRDKLDNQYREDVIWLKSNGFSI